MRESRNKLNMSYTTGPSVELHSLGKNTKIQIFWKGTITMTCKWCCKAFSCYFNSSHIQILVLMLFRDFFTLKIPILGPVLLYSAIATTVGTQPLSLFYYLHFDSPALLVNAIFPHFERDIFQLFDCNFSALRNLHSSVNGPKGTFLIEPGRQIH